MVKVATAQLEPEWLDLEASVAKTIKYIEEAAKNKAALVAFPEVFIPGYPHHMWGTPADLDINLKYVKNSLSVNSPQFRRITAAAKKNSIAVVLGFSERNEGGSLYLSQAIIDDAGEVKLIRRKCKPTHVERAIFGDGGPDYLDAVKKLKIGGEEFNLGCLNCWEHTQPLLIYYNATGNEEIHVGGWPAMNEANEVPHVPRPMRADGCRTLSQSYATENVCYYLIATGVIGEKYEQKIGPIPDFFKLGGGFGGIIAPDGTLIAEADSTKADQLIYGEIDRDQISLNRHFLHTVGHYSRPDMLSLKVDKTPQNHVNKVLDRESV